MIITEWISVNDRLPTECGDYIAYNVYKEVMLCHFNPPNKEQVPGWSTCDAEGFYRLSDNFITYWMPLPEPPKDGEN